jgi:hypothetical protein
VRCPLLRTARRMLTAHPSTTTTQNAQATVNFWGNGIALFGAANTSHGTYSVSLDGATATSYNAAQISFRPQQILVSTGCF